MCARHLLEMVNTIFCERSEQKLEVTGLSVIPCRLNDDLHEWYNEIATVPS